jgi:hypothetical protein
MTADAVVRATEQLRARLETALGEQVYVGPPIVDDVGDRKLSLFLFHIVVNQALRNERHYVPRPVDPSQPLVEAEALPLDLRFLLSVFRSAGAGMGGMADPDELLTLGRAVQTLHQYPFIDGFEVPDQYARITPESYPMEELSQIWGLFPRASYRTSMVYLVSPVYVSLDPSPPGTPVVRRTSRQGQLTDVGTPS